MARKEEAAKNGGAAAAKKETAFVISQIGDEKSDVRNRADEVLDFIISPVAIELNLEVIRSDRDPTPGHVTSRLIKLILDSRVIIADLTGRNANVFYELGVAHSFRLPVVILVDHISTLSFDTEHERVIEIGDEGTITARQADIAKKKLRETLTVVLEKDYKPSSLVTEVAEAQSLANLAPNDPVASEVATIKQRIDELAALVRTALPVSTAGAEFVYKTPLVNQLRSYSALTPGISPFLYQPATPLVVSSDEDLAYLNWVRTKEAHQKKEATPKARPTGKPKPEIPKVAKDES